MHLDDSERAGVRTAFDAAVNMTTAAFDRWLDSAESRAAGWPGAEAELGAGHRWGRLILAIRRKRPDRLTHADYVHMLKVIDEVQRHLAQRPAGNIEHSRWRYSLMNWGHDPLKD